MTLTQKDILTISFLVRMGQTSTKAMIAYIRQIENLPPSADLLYQLLLSAQGMGIIKKTYWPEEVAEAEAYAQKVILQCQDAGIGITTCMDADFPPQLQSIKNKGYEQAPPVLYYKGKLQKAIVRKGVAVIGTRQPHTEGREATYLTGKVLGKKGINVISGLALGCDTAAHQGALDSGGTTTAFLFNGLNEAIYPHANEDLATQIVENGGLIACELAPDVHGKVCHIVGRDKLQSGLADALIVGQTPAKGGTMIAVGVALENHKPVYAINYPPSIQRQLNTDGNRLLIESGKAIPLAYEHLEKEVRQLAQNLNGHQ